MHRAPETKDQKNAKQEKERKKKEKRLACWRKWASPARVRQITPSMEMRTIWRECVLYLLFLLFTVFSTLGMSDSETYRLTYMIEEIFTQKQDTKGRSFANMRTQEDWWNYAQSTLADNFLWDVWFQNTETFKPAEEEDRNVLLENKIMGSPRLRQVRVKANSCSVYQKFKKKFSSCYAPYSKDTEAKESFGLGVGTAWTYYSPNQIKGKTYRGRLATYPGGGYYQDISTADRDSFIGTIEVLKNNNWIDRGTRALFIDFTLYNANANIFCVATLIMEFPSTGGVLPAWDIKTLKFFHYVRPFEYFVLGCQIMFIAYTIYHVVEEIREIVIFKYHYFFHFWNFYDLFTVLICVACVLISVLRSVTVESRIDGLIKGGDEFSNFQEVAYWEVQAGHMNGITVFFVWIKILKFFKFSKTMCQLTLTLGRCSKDIIAFTVLFLLFFMAYVQCGYMIFDGEVEGYGTISESCYTLLLTMLGDFDFKSLQKADSICGPLFFISFIFLVVIILLNVYLAIIADSYAEVKADTEDVKFYDMGVFLCQGFRKILIASSCVKKEKKVEEKERITWKMVRRMLKKHRFTDDEVDAFQRRYGIEEEDEILRESDAARILEDMRGGFYEEPEETINVTELGPAYKKIQTALNNLTTRVDYIEESLIDLLPRVEELIRAIDRIAPTD